MEALFQTEAGQAFIAAVGAALALGIRSGVRWLRDKAAGTPTKLDDKLLSAAEEGARRALAKDRNKGGQ